MPAAAQKGQSATTTGGQLDQSTQEENARRQALRPLSRHRSPTCRTRSALFRGADSTLSDPRTRGWIGPHRMRADLRAPGMGSAESITLRAASESALGAASA